MIRPVALAWWLILVACAAAVAKGDRMMDTQSAPYVVLAYDDSGDFGPDTPGTKTSGWQEALDFCVAHNRDLYVKGGWGGRIPVYRVSDTIHIPATQDFRIEGGIYVVNWTGPPGRDLLVVDSTMDGHYTFGILVYGGTGAALRIKPENPTPIDGFPVFTDSEIAVSSIADPRPFERGEREAGAGVVFDTSKAPIVHAEFRFTAVLNFATCIETPSSGALFAYNRITCGHLHTNADNSMLLRLGNHSIQNTLQMAIGVDQGATGVKGIDLFGVNNVLEVTTRGGFAEASDVIFEESAAGNQVNLVPGPFDPLELVTDKALTPTNQLTWPGTPAPLRKVEATPGTFTYTQRLYPATVRVVGGGVTRVTLLRGSASVDYGIQPPDGVLMSVADKLVVESTNSPTLEVIPLKVK